MPKPPFMFVPHYQDCLATKDMGTWVSWCLPSTVANGCPMDSFNMLTDGPMAFDGPKCDEDVNGMPPTPEYLNIPHYKECLGTKDMGLWVSYCMPSTVANGCPLDSFNKLKDAFDGPDCNEPVKSMPPTPEYMNVPHYKECLGNKDMGLWVSYCMPSTIANGCPLDSFNKLKDVFDGPACDDSLAPKPEYLDVPHYKECLGHKNMGLWGSLCMPATIANGCPLDSFNKLKEVFDGPDCDDKVKAGGMPPTPEYLNIPHYKECLGDKDMGKWVSFCMPATIANGCPLDSFNKLKEVFDGPDCDDAVEVKPPTPAPRPAYLDIPMWDKCLSEKDMGLWGSLCLPKTVANGCPLDSYNKLKNVFDGPDCDELVGGMPPTPEYLNIPHYRECLGHEDHGLWWEYCMPNTRSNGCPQQSWEKLGQVFDGAQCKAQ